MWEIGKISYIEGEIRMIAQTINKAKDKFSTHTILETLLVLAGGIIILTQFILADVPAPNLVVYNLGVVLYNISLSYVVSFIFYLVGFLPERKKKKAIQEYIIKHSNSIVGDKKIVISEIEKATKLDCTTETGLAEVFSKINPHEKAPMIIDFNSGADGKVQMVYANWAQYLYYYIKQTRKSIDKLKPYFAYMENDMYDKINEIDECMYFIMADTMFARINMMANTDLTSCVSEFWKYIIKVDELDKLNLVVKKLYHID